MVKQPASPLAEQNQELIEQNRLLSSQLLEAREDLQVLIHSGRWLVWVALVSETAPGEPSDWRYRSDYSAAALRWLPIGEIGVSDFGEAIVSARLPEDSAACDENFAHALYAGLPGYSQEFRVRLRTGEIRWLSETVHIEVLTPTSWRLTGIGIDITDNKRNEEELESIRREVMVQNAELQDMQAELEAQNDELARANARLENLAMTDGLTGLRNHRAFQETLEHAWRIAQRHGSPLSLIFLDIDHFKQYNDAYGHPAGDEVLKEVGALLLAGARDTDCVARYGGEEFVVVAPQTDADGAVALAERFRERIFETPFPHRNVTASFGVATTVGPGGEPQTLIAEADRALYDAKEQGRNRVIHAAEGNDQATQDQPK